MKTRNLGSNFFNVHFFSNKCKKNLPGGILVFDRRHFSRYTRIIESHKYSAKKREKKEAGRSYGLYRGSSGQVTFLGNKAYYSPESRSRLEMGKKNRELQYAVNNFFFFSHVFPFYFFSSAVIFPLELRISKLRKKAFND